MSPSLPTPDHALVVAATALGLDAEVLRRARPGEARSPTDRLALALVSRLNGPLPADARTPLVALLARTSPGLLQVTALRARESGDVPTLAAALLDWIGSGRLDPACDDWSDAVHAAVALLDTGPAAALSLLPPLCRALLSTPGALDRVEATEGAWLATHLARALPRFPSGADWLALVRTLDALGHPAEALAALRTASDGALATIPRSDLAAALAHGSRDLRLALTARQGPRR